MQLADFHFDLPPALIATHPPARREAARLMALMAGGATRHLRVEDLPELARPGDCWVVNNSRVIPARLSARRAGGGACELLLLEPLPGGDWRAMARPARKLKVGDVLELPGGARAEIIPDEAEESGDGEAGGRTRRLRFEIPGGADIMAYLDAHGEIPLPPYILRQRRERGEDAAAPEDRERYQTVYARPRGSVAAPTAGLHLTPEIMEVIRSRGGEFREATLHVGAGTFEPVTVDDVSSHVMHREWFEIGAEDAAAIEAARRDPARRVVAVGTTTVRALEGCAALRAEAGEDDLIAPLRAATRIFIRPGYDFKVVDALMTNFHLPDSTLILLAAAFAGKERLLAAYREAVEKQYRFFSYGDAMFIGKQCGSASI